MRRMSNMPMTLSTRYGLGPLAEKWRSVRASIVSIHRFVIEAHNGPAVNCFFFLFITFLFKYIIDEGRSVPLFGRPPSAAGEVQVYGENGDGQRVCAKYSLSCP